MNENFFIALTLTSIAWIATAFGGAIIFFTKTISHKFLSHALGFAWGVMIYISFAELLPESISELSAFYSTKQAHFLATFCFFLGILSMFFVKKIFPDPQANSTPHTQITQSTRKKILYTGVFSAFIITLHNIPEGLITFISTLKNPELGFNISLAMMIHNIPEWIIIAVPLFFATQKKWKSFLLALYSGLAEIFGALFGYFIITKLFWEIHFGYIFACISGIMVFVSFSELLPTAQEYGGTILANFWLFSGMFVMAMSLLLF